MYYSEHMSMWLDMWVLFLHSPACKGTFGSDTSVMRLSLNYGQMGGNTRQGESFEWRPVVFNPPNQTNKDSKEE